MKITTKTICTNNIKNANVNKKQNISIITKKTKAMKTHERSNNTQLEYKHKQRKQKTIIIMNNQI